MSKRRLGEGKSGGNKEKSTELGEEGMGGKDTIYLTAQREDRLLRRREINNSEKRSNIS